MKNKRKEIAIILNIALILLEIIGNIVCFKTFGSFRLIYYTQQSNMLALIAAIVYIVTLFTKKNLPKFVSILKYISVLSLIVTFLVALFILSPMNDYRYGFMMLYASSLFFHTLCPIIAFVSFVFFEKHNIKGKRDNLRAVYYTILYALVYIFLNIFKVVDGPYPFLQVCKNPWYMSIIWLLVIVGGAFGIARLIEVLKNMIEKKIYKED